jgi:hypothetical protein
VIQKTKEAPDERGPLTSTGGESVAIGSPATLPPHALRGRLAAVELALHRMLFDGWAPSPGYLRHLADELEAIAMAVDE